MTKEEAQELIAEIKHIFYVKGFNGCTQEYSQVEKIINRFANKPPKEGFTAWSEEANINILHSKDDSGRNIVQLNIRDDESNKIYNFRMGQAQRLTQQINLMLEYLEGV